MNSSQLINKLSRDKIFIKAAEYRNALAKEIPNEPLWSSTELAIKVIGELEECIEYIKGIPSQDAIRLGRWFLFLHIRAIQEKCYGMMDGPNSTEQSFNKFV